MGRKVGPTNGTILMLQYIQNLQYKSINLNVLVNPQNDNDVLLFCNNLFQKNYQNLLDNIIKIHQHPQCQSQQWQLTLQFLTIMANGYLANNINHAKQFINELIQMGQKHNLPICYVEAAMLLAEHHQTEEAAQIFKQIFKAYHPKLLIKPCNNRQLVALNMAQIDMIPRVKHIMTSQSDLGVAQKEITPEQEGLIKDKLFNAMVDYQYRNLHIPKFQGQYKIIPKLPHKKILIIGGQYQNGSETAAEQDVSYNYYDSAINMGFTTEWVKIDGAEYPQSEWDRKTGKQNRIINGKPFRATRETKLVYLNAIEEKIKEFQPDLVIVSNPGSNHEDTLNSEDFYNLKKQYNFKLMGFIGDYYCFGGNFHDPFIAGEMQKYYDLVHVNDTIHPNYEKHVKNGVQIHFPTMPYKPVVQKPKTIDFGFSGYEYKNRDAFLGGLGDYIPNSQVYLNNRHFNDVFKSFYEFLDFYAKTKITFSTSYLDESNYLNATRIREGIISKTLLLHEKDTTITLYYVPFVHYIPVTNRNEVIIYSQFFTKHEQYRQQITENAFQFYNNNYSQYHYWSYIFQKLQFV